MLMYMPIDSLGYSCIKQRDNLLYAYNMPINIIQCTVGIQCIKLRLLLQRGFNSIVYFCSHFRTVGGAFYYRDWNQNTQQDLIPCGICNAAQRGPCLLAHQSLHRATGTYRDVGTDPHQVLSKYKNKTYFNNKPLEN